jgi:biopolymer transport protein TolR
MAFSGGGSGGGGSQASTHYRSLRARQAQAPMGDINVTPLVDVVLVLLLVFMVTAPMMTRGIDVSLPVADLPDIPPQERVTVSVDAKGRIHVGERLAVNVAAVEDLLRSIGNGKSPRTVYLQADQSLRYGQVIDVAEAIRKAGAEEVGFAYITEQEAAARSK